MVLQSQPTDLDLINTYLRPWVEEGVKTGSFIHEADVYAADPSDLTLEYAPAVAQDGEKAWYFYTTLRHKSVRGKRKKRTVASGSGCWHNEAKPKPVYTGINGRRQIGYRQSFSFVTKKQGGQRNRTGWLMMELRLLKDSACAGKEARDESALGNLALCKVYCSPRNPPEAAAGYKAKADDDGDKSSSATSADDGDSSEATPDRKSDDESSEATVAAPNRYSKAAEEEIPGAPPREDSANESAAAPPPKRKLEGDENSGAAAPPSKKPIVGTYPGPVAPVVATEMHCPQCGTHLVVTLKKSETETEDGPSAPDAAPERPFHRWL